MSSSQRTRGACAVCGLRLQRLDDARSGGTCARRSVLAAWPTGAGTPRGCSGSWRGSPRRWTAGSPSDRRSGSDSRTSDGTACLAGRAGRVRGSDPPGSSVGGDARAVKPSCAAAQRTAPSRFRAGRQVDRGGLDGTMRGTTLRSGLTRPAAASLRVDSLAVATPRPHRAFGGFARAGRTLATVASIATRLHRYPGPCPPPPRPGQRTRTVGARSWGSARRLRCACLPTILLHTP